MPSDLRAASIGFVVGGLVGGSLVGVAAWWFSPAPPTSPAEQVLAATQAVLDDHARIQRMRDALVHTSSARLAVAEAASNLGRPPAGNAEAGLADSQAWRSHGLDDVSVLADGTVDARFALPMVGRVRFRPSFADDGGDLGFQCTSPDIADIERIAPGCRFRPDDSDGRRP